MATKFLTRTFYLLTVSVFPVCIFSQSTTEHYIESKDSIRLGEEPTDIVPMNPKGYTLTLPAGKKIKAVVIQISDNKPEKGDTATTRFFKELNKRQIATLHISTGIPVDLFFKQHSVLFTDSIIENVYKRFNIQSNNIFLLGVMPSGHRALKYYASVSEKNGMLKPKIKGIILCESAIDWVRQYQEAKKQVRDSLTAIGYYEGKMVIYLFTKYLNLPEDGNLKDLIDFSPYSYFESSMQKPKTYRDLFIRAYTTADTNYWFSAKGKGIFDCNFPDMQGFINEQKLAGNKHAELIVFAEKGNKGKFLQKQSDTWNKVNKSALANWISSAAD
jgi:predicted transcriptional regulator